MLDKESKFKNTLSCATGEKILSKKIEILVKAKIETKIIIKVNG